MNSNIFPLFLKTDGDTNNVLVETIHLDSNKEWGIGLFSVYGALECSSPLYPNSVYLCCDIVAPSYVFTTKLPSLEMICPKGKTGKVDINNGKVMWVKVIRDKISCIRLYLRDSDGKPISLLNCSLTCKLLILPFVRK